MEKYDVKKVVGEGSYGKAILCKRKVDAKLCIIKQISIKKLSRKEALLTEQEATLLKRLQHPNIVTFWESFVTNSSLHIVMEYADGGDLDHYIKAHAKSVPRRDLPEKQVLHMFVQLSLAIKHIHDRKILHRDLKSQNVFLTSSGTLKLGDFGVSRVLRHTVELAATQIGTPYYMSPEIMDNQRYNSKTDIWSLGCILYELMCLRLPFDGASMKQLCYNIIKVNPASPSMSYSAELRELVRDTLHKNPKIRPGINSILSRPIMRSRISVLLGQTQQQAEFSHTVLHGANVLNSAPLPVPAPAPAPAPVQALARYPPQQQHQLMQAQQPPSRPSSQQQQAPQPAGRPSSAPSVPPVLSSAAQAVAMLQQQRQQQLMRQAQNQAQQQQYVGAMAAQMKEQIEVARLAEAARVRAQQQQMEEQQLRLKQQAVAKAKEQQQRALQEQQQAERQKALDLLKRQQQLQQFEQLERMKRAALAEQQRKLEQRRQERLDYEKEKEKEKEKLRAQAARQQQLAQQQQQQQARRVSASPVPAPVAAPAPAPNAVVRQFSAGALLARRRHSAPEQAPPAYLARPSSANQLYVPAPAPAPSAAPAVPKQHNPFQAIVGNSNANGAEVGKQRPAPQNPPYGQQVQAQPQPAKAPVPTRAPVPQQAYVAAPKQAAKVAPSAPQPVASKATPRSAKREPWNDDVVIVSAPLPEPVAKGSPLRLPSAPTPAESPSSRVSASDQSDLRKMIAQNAIVKAQEVLNSVQGMQIKPRNDRPSPQPARAAALNISASSDGSSDYGDILPDTPQQTAGADADDEDREGQLQALGYSASEDEADTQCAGLAAPKSAPSVPGARPGLRLDGVSVADSASDAEGGSASPWLSDLMGQMGVLKNQMRNLQQMRSPVVQPSAQSSPDIQQSGSGSSDYNGDSLSSSPVSSITAASPAGPASYSSNGPPSAYQQPCRPPLSNAKNAGNTGPKQPQQQEPQQQPQQLGRSAKMGSQRMSFPLTSESSAAQLKKQQQQDLVSADDSTADPLVQRKESRAKHNADFRAFVEAQRRRNAPLHPSGSADQLLDGLEQDSVYSVVSADDSDCSAPNSQLSAAPVLRIRVPVPRASQHGGAASSDNTPNTGLSAKGKGAGASPGVAMSGKGPAPAQNRAHAGAAQSKAKGSAPSVPKRADPAVKHRHAGTPPIPSAASSPHSYQPDAASPSAAGFNVEEFRSQRDAQRREMRNLMQQRRKELQQHVISNEDIVEAPEESVYAEYRDKYYQDNSAGVAVVSAKAESPAPSQGGLKVPGSGDSVGADQSRLFQHLQESHDLDHLSHNHASLAGAGAPVASRGAYLGESFVQQIHSGRGHGHGHGHGHHGAGVASGAPCETSMLEYSVLIEQMQAILRNPPAASHRNHGATVSQQQLRAGVKAGEPAERTPIRSGAGLGLGAVEDGTLPRRALLGELIMEQDDEDDESQAEVEGEHGVEQGQGQGQQQPCEEGEEDSDAFEEEDFTLHLGQGAEGPDQGLDEAQHLQGYDEEGESQVTESGAYAGEGYGDDGEVDGDDSRSETDDVEADHHGIGMQDEVLHYGAQTTADPFMQPLVPAMLTADVMLLDPLRVVEHYHHQRQHRLEHQHHAEAALQTPSKSASAAPSSEAAAAERERRLQVAELQEYLVGQLGSAKVSQALHLLSVNTEATMGASPGDAERGDNYYDERDEELLNKIEDILGADSLHYLDDMLLLLTLQ